MKAPWNVERNKKYRYKGEKAGNWKGLEVGYIALHQWMRKNFDWLEVCELCPITRGLHLSNKTQIYTRDKENWWILCASCHRRYDNSYRKNGGVIKIPHRWVKQNPQ